jgi:hypothetical protein
MDEKANPDRVVHAPQPLTGDVPAAGEGLLEEALPTIREAARQVGGFKRLAEIAEQLDRDGTGQ